MQLGKVSGRLKLTFIGFAAVSGLIAGALLVPPIRDRIFSTKLWPWPLPWDTDEAELEVLKSLSLPGDVILESNLHGWQWMALSFAATRTTWVHASLIDENKQILTVHKLAILTDWNIYFEWGSTRLALIRPPYQNKQQAQSAIDYARTKLGTKYDASFQDHSGNCNGLVASSLAHVGLPVFTTDVYGRKIYSPDCFLKIPGAEIIWSSDLNR
ncbi:hypothetical protein BH10CYA1_BH10CYA1_14290 [soil metagenome]